MSDNRTAYHVTTLNNVSSIMDHGLRDVSYWATDLALVEYYSSVVEDEGEIPVVVLIPLEDLKGMQVTHQLMFEPDDPGIAEPITSVVGMSEKQVIAAWGEAEGTWEECVELIGSFRVRGSVPGRSLGFARVDDLLYGHPEESGWRPS